MTPIVKDICMSSVEVDDEEGEAEAGEPEDDPEGEEDDEDKVADEEPRDAGDEAEAGGEATDATVRGSDGDTVVVLMASPDDDDNLCSLSLDREEEEEEEDTTRPVKVDKEGQVAVVVRLKVCNNWWCEEDEGERSVEKGRADRRDDDDDKGVSGRVTVGDTFDDEGVKLVAGDESTVEEVVTVNVEQPTPVIEWGDSWRDVPVGDKDPEEQDVDDMTLDAIDDDSPEVNWAGLQWLEFIPGRMQIHMGRRRLQRKRERKTTSINEMFLSVSRNKLIAFYLAFQWREGRDTTMRGETGNKRGRMCFFPGKSWV